MPNKLDLDINLIKRLKQDGNSCAKISRMLGCSAPSVLRIARQHGIIFTAFKDSARIAQFLTIEDPTVAYFLGYIWADGFLISRRRKGLPTLHQGIGIQLRKDDGEHLFSLVKDKMSISAKDYQRIYSDGSKRHAQLSMTLSDSVFARWLVSDCDYDKKSGVAPTKILDRIPKQYHGAFWLGYFDGDGTLGNDKLTSFSSVYDQDWSETENLCRALDVKWRIRRYVSPKGHKASSLRLVGKAASLSLMGYFSPFKHLALRRKWERFDHIVKLDKTYAHELSVRDEQARYIATHWYEMTESELAKALDISFYRVRHLKKKVIALNPRHFGRPEPVRATETR